MTQYYESVYQANITRWEIKEESQGNNLSYALKDEYELGDKTELCMVTRRKRRSTDIRGHDVFEE